MKGKLCDSMVELSPCNHVMNSYGTLWWNQDGRGYDCGVVAEEEHCSVKTEGHPPL